MESKTFLIGTILLSICLLTILLLVFYYQKSSHNGNRHFLSNRSLTDLDTLSSELDLSADIEFQDTSALHVSKSKYRTVPCNQKPKGILKKSRTTENLHLYNNPRAESILRYSSLGRHGDLSVNDTQCNEPVIQSEPSAQVEENCPDLIIAVVEPDCLLLSESGKSEQNQLPLSDSHKQMRNVSKESFVVDSLKDCNAAKDVIKPSDTIR